MRTEQLAGERRPGVSLPRVASESLLGVPLAITDYERTLDWIDASVAAGARGYICVAAVHTVMACQEDPALRAAVHGRELHGARTASRSCGRSTRWATGCPTACTGPS